MALVTVQRSPTPSTTSSPCVSESGSGEDDRRSQPRSISESFLTVKGAALFLPRGNGSSSSSGSHFSELRSKHAGDIQQHLQTMFTVLRPEDNIKLAVRLESAHTLMTRYMVVVSTNGRQDTEESVVLGVDFSPVDSSCSVGLVLPLWSDTLIHLDGDGGFSVSTDCRVHVFKPVSVQAMWSALQSLHKACEVARCHNYFPGSLFLTWVSYYKSRVSSDQALINEWNAMQDLQSYRADSPVLFSDTPTERELTEREIKSSLREIMMQKDLENVTCKEIRTELEMHMTCNLREFKEFIDNEMIVILGQMDSPTQIFDHVFLGSEWNASNLEELQNSGVHYILNVTREIDNFFPGVFEYHNIRVYDEEATDLLAYWNDTYKFITRAKKNGSRCLVHCKMGISRSAATVIAYAMKEYGWDLTKAFDYVKERRAVTKPNPSFMRQLEEYQGILLASKQRHNKLWRSHSDSDLSEHHEPLYKAARQPHSLGRSDLRNQVAVPLGPSVKELLESLGPNLPSRPLRSPPCDCMVASPCGASPVASPSSPPFSNGLCEPEEERHPSASGWSPPLSLPTAATVVPELPRADAVTVAQSVALGQPYPPAALQHLSPSPAPSPPPPFWATVSMPEAEISQEGRCSGLPALSLVHKEDCSIPDGPPSAGDAFISPCVLFDHRDRINFFTAREKFKGMTRDSRGAQQHSPPPPEFLAGDELKRKTIVPVQVTGLKLAVQSEWSKLGQLEHGGQEVRGSEQEVEGGDLCCQTMKQEVKNKEEEEDGSRLYRDWTRGSVRCVTRQLERRMQREHHIPPPSSSPPSNSGSPSVSQRCTPAQPITTRDREEEHAVKPGPVIMTSGNARNADSDWLSVVDFLCAGGTSGPHWDGVILKETWEMLRELGAFLLQVSVGVAGTNRKRGGGAQRRLREVEARIRQAGLTPPSLMKRSASLAKLGCLELLANDLTEWELSRAHADTDSAAQPSADSPFMEPLVHAGAEDPKKQRVHDTPSSVDRTPAASGVPAGESLRWPRDSSLSSSSSSLPLLPTLPLFTSRQQYGRSHPVRRLKKTTLSALYHTM
ncbi:protein phosphatase Slingshot homolog 2b isoform X2 [Phycodurus eques]|uniref:protein phosphatase Slingshot homolog 2b isoform X2 n=1 Tax=Phycodurus eques TaxID=693459 RepID=UPI002ACDC469|nr:protein phosphatase Slingshot homolog 2b isoform X2 [Phycodurus eques]XP_061557813.1 protein phosphatase Slingshot homolog 2b isoform X2 [Phycodurus eques]